MKILLLFSVIFLLSCSDDNKEELKIGSKLGEQVFAENCATCHGKQAMGLVKDWKKPINGRYPAPPLNGQAHAWHHSPKLLLATINNGGVKLGGTMPGFKDKLNEMEKQSILSYLYSLWNADIQQKYQQKFNTEYEK
jgi:mono/diheme cytochrome c family protein